MSHEPKLSDNLHSDRGAPNLVIQVWNSILAFS